MSPHRHERHVDHQGFTYIVERSPVAGGQWCITIWNSRGHLANRRHDVDEPRLDDVEQQLLDESAEHERTPTPLDQATWLLGLVAKRMTLQPDGTAHVTLPGEMVRHLNDFLTEQATRP